MERTHFKGASGDAIREELANADIMAVDTSYLFNLIE
jgi:hypothetical protein